MQLQFIGSGDAFGSGGRLNTCFHIKGETTNVLIDCGASSLVGLKANDVARNDIETIFVTHFHADHFGGISFFMLDAQLVSRRTRPLTIVGPHGLKIAYEKFMETGFPGSTSIEPRFELTLVEAVEREPRGFGSVTATPFLVTHGQPGGPFFAWRLESEGQSIAYTGDTEWTDALIDAGRDVDLFIAEAYYFDKKVRMHLDYATLASHLDEIAPKRMVLTHMSDDMLKHADDVPFETAEDGLIVDL